MRGDFCLGDWLVQPDLCRLSKGGRIVQVRAKVMDLLAYLAEHAGEVIPKGRLLDDVWGSQAISESALTRTVTELRQALGDDAEQPRLLETIPMSLEDFKLPETRNSRTPYALLLLGVSAAVTAAWRIWVGSRYSVEIMIGVTVVAVAYAVLRYARQRDP